MVPDRAEAQSRRGPSSPTVRTAQWGFIGPSVHPRRVPFPPARLLPSGRADRSPVSTSAVKPSLLKLLWCHRQEGVH